MKEMKHIDESIRSAVGEAATGHAHLKTFRGIFEEIITEGRRIGAPYAARSPEVKASLDRFENFCGERLKDLNPKLMVYGIYNAGKSTLINALLGGEFAPVGDIPTTKAVNSYNWREYTIYDTPGINAPERDEEVSKEQLEKSDVILFVMDTAGDFSLAKNYRELAEIARSKKRLLIVLNDKDDMMLFPEEVHKIESRIYEDFASLVDGVTPEALAQKFRLVTVNAQRALKARMRADLPDEKRAALVRASNIEVLEAAIVEEYGRASGKTILAQLATMFGTELDRLTRRLEDLQKDVLARRGQEALDELRALQDRIRSRVVDFAKDQEGALRDEVRAVIESDEDPASAEQKIDEIGERCAKKAFAVLEKECEAASIQFSAVVSRFEKCAVDLKGFVPKVVVDDVTRAGSTIVKVPRGEASGIPGGKSAATTAALYAAKPLVSKALGKAAAGVFGKAIPYVGVALLVWDVGKMIFGESSEEKAQRERMDRIAAVAEAEERRQRELARWRSEVSATAFRAARAIVTNICERLDVALEAILKPSYVRIGETIAANRSEAARLVKDVSAIAALKDRLRSFADGLAA